MPTKNRLNTGLLAAMVVLFSGCPSGPPIQLDGWLFDLYSSNSGHTVSQRADGGFFIAGNARFDGETSQNYALLLSGAGEMESKIALPGVYSQARNGPDATALVTAANEVYVAGLTMFAAGPDSRQGRLRIVKTSPGGNVFWDYTYGEEHWVPRAIVEVADDGIAVALEIITLDRGRPEMLLRLDQNGGVIWATEIPAEHSRFVLNDAELTEGGGFVLAGYDSSSNPDSAAWAIDADGSSLWFRRYDRPGSNEARSVELAPGGGLYLGGTQILANGKRRPYLLKTDADGEFEWDRDDIYLPAYAGSDVQIWDMVVDDEGYIAMVGDEITVDYIGTIPVTKGNSFLMRLDPMGNLVKKTDIGGLTYGIDFTQQGTYITTGVADKYIRVLEINKAGKVVN